LRQCLRLVLRGRGRLRQILSQDRLEQQYYQKREHEHEQKPALHARLLLRILKFWQVLVLNDYKDPARRWSCFRSSLPDPLRLWQTDDNALAARPLSRFPAALRIAPLLPSRIPNSSEHSGRPEETWARSSAYIRAAALSPAFGQYRSWFTESLAVPRRRLLDRFFNYAKRHTDLTLQLGKVRLEGGFLWVDDHVHRNNHLRCLQTDRFPQAAFHSIALYRSAQNFPHTKTKPGCIALGSQQVKQCHMRGEVALAPLVHPLEVAMPERPPAAWEPRAGAGARRGAKVLGSNLAHIHHQIQVANASAIPKGKSIPGNRASRKPVCALWRAGGRSPPAHPEFSSGCENHVSSSADAGWVGTYVWALNLTDSCFHWKYNRGAERKV